MTAPVAVRRGAVASAVPNAPAAPGRRRPGRHLRPVDRPAPRRSAAVPVVVGTGIVIATLFALAAMHALLIGGQIRLDDMRRDAASQSEEVRRLQLRVAELESPDRVLDVARERLGMVAPAEVGYLLPRGVDGSSAEPQRVDAAQPPPPPEPASVAEDGTTDPAGDAADADGSDASAPDGRAEENE